MAMSNNSYTEKEDKVLFDLHEVRREIAEKKYSIQKINELGNEIAHELNIKKAEINFIEIAK